MSNSTAPNQPAGGRVASIDIIRGAVMALMAIDHVRVYRAFQQAARRTASSSPGG